MSAVAEPGVGRSNLGDFERVGSIIVGAALMLLGLRGARRRWGTVAAGSALAARGLSGFSPLYAALGRDRLPRRPVRIVETFQVNAPPAATYRAWRDLERLPRFMEHLRSVSERNGVSHWVAQFGGMPAVSWDAHVIRDEPPHAVSWRSTPESQIETAGSVTFFDLGARGTGLRVELAYYAPAGPFGMSVARLLSPMTEQQIRADVRRFKQLIEAGEVPRIAGQPSGREASAS